MSSVRVTRCPAPLAAGTVIGRRFRALRRVGAGGMGEVWLGEHVQLHFPVALKVLHKEALANHELVTRFSREAFLLAQIRSEHVARAFDFVSGRHGPVLVMEFIEGLPLSVVLRERKFTVEEGIALGIDIASALRELHAANVIHRDVKPANIMLRPQRDASHRAVFVDLGVGRLVSEARVADEEKLTEITSDDRAIGTMEYMAPEQILSSRTVTPGADLYALGAILYRAVAGEHVYGAEQGVALAKMKLSVEPPRLVTKRTDRVAMAFESLVARALAPAPEDRYEVADEILTDLSLLRDMSRHAALQTSLIARRPAKPSRRPPPLPTKPAIQTAETAKTLTQPRKRSPLRTAMACSLVLLAATSLEAAGDKTTTGAVAGPCVVEATHANENAAEGKRLLSLSISCEEPADR